MHHLSHRVTRFAGNTVMIRKWIILAAGGLVGTVLSIWLLEDWVWSIGYGYTHGTGERLTSLRITAVAGLVTGVLCTAKVWPLLNRSHGDSS